jgi:hypothetical protein
LGFESAGNRSRLNLFAPGRNFVAIGGGRERESFH